jgi:hypothetical protein
MRLTKVVVGVFAGLLVALLAGWLWGGSSLWRLDRALQASEVRSDLLEARNSVLDARLALYSVNVGDASRHLENARHLLRRARQRLAGLGWADDMKQLDLALVRIDEAQRLAGQVVRRLNGLGRPGDVKQPGLGLVLLGGE